MCCSVGCLLCGFCSSARTFALRACEKIDFPRQIRKKWQLAKEQEKKALQVRAAIDGAELVPAGRLPTLLASAAQYGRPIGLQRR
jgi:hypothetical protein